MFKNIKLNFMQWSKGELKKKHKAYYEQGHDKKKK